MFFLLVIRDFIFILGLILHFFVILDSFQRYTTFGRCDGPIRTYFTTSLPGSTTPVGCLWA